MLTIIDHRGKQYVKLSEFYDRLELPRKTYPEYVKRNIVDHEIPSKYLDYIQIQDKKHGKGRPRTDFLISIEFLKTLCFHHRSNKSKQVKAWADDFRSFTII